MDYNKSICSRTSREMQIIEIFLRGIGQSASLLHLNIFQKIFWNIFKMSPRFHMKYQMYKLKCVLFLLYVFSLCFVSKFLGLTNFKILSPHKGSKKIKAIILPKPNRHTR